MREVSFCGASFLFLQNVKTKKITIIKDADEASKYIDLYYRSHSGLTGKGHLNLDIFEVMDIEHYNIKDVCINDNKIIYLKREAILARISFEEDVFIFEEINKDEEELNTHYFKKLFSKEIKFKCSEKNVKIVKKLIQYNFKTSYENENLRSIGDRIFQDIDTGKYYLKKGNFLEETTIEQMRVKGLLKSIETEKGPIFYIENHHRDDDASFVNIDIEWLKTIEFEGKFEINGFKFMFKKYLFNCEYPYDINNNEDFLNNFNYLNKENFTNIKVDDRTEVSFYKHSNVLDQECLSDFVFTYHFKKNRI